jgi:phosphate transport system substrate-binding protein
MKFAAKTLLLSLLAFQAQPLLAAENIRISSAGLAQPLAQKAWAEFKKEATEGAASIEIATSAEAFKKLCPAGADANTDIVFATRAMTKAERAACVAGDNSTVTEMQIGYYGIVFANMRGQTKLHLTKKQVFMALAAEIPDASGKLVKNPYNTWKEVDTTLPDIPISFYGPSQKPGLYYMLTENIMPDGCKKLPAILAMPDDSKERLHICRTIRKDGKYHAVENAAEVVANLDTQSVGIMDIESYNANLSKAQSAKLEGMMPEQEDIGSVRYNPVVNLYVYVSKQNAAKNPAIAKYLQYLTSDAAIGESGHLTKEGLVALNSVERKTAEETALNLAVKKQP